MKTTGLAAAGAIAVPRRAAAPFRTAPNDLIGIGVIGCNGMGFSNLRSFLNMPEVECRALCDVDRNVLETRAADVEKLTGARPALYRDFRALLDNPDVDAVIIGTPDHWHCLMMVSACEAGKDVYVEKPLANSIQECDVMLKAAKKYDRVVQVGQCVRESFCNDLLLDLAEIRNRTFCFHALFHHEQRRPRKGGAVSHRLNARGPIRSSASP